MLARSARRGRTWRARRAERPPGAGAAGGADVAPLVSLLVQAGAAVEEVRKDKGSLEDVFLTLMEEDR